MSDQNPVRVERKGAVQWITIDRPERRNALNEAVLAGIAEGIRGAMTDGAARAIVLTGAGEKAFCAGADLVQGAGSPLKLDPSRATQPMIELFRLIETCNLPLIARVNGHVLAGGMGLLCACDMAVAAESALFGTPEVKVGLFPMQVLSYMVRVIPRRKLMEMAITGEPFTAAEALEMGLVNYIVPAAELDAKLDWLLGRTLDKSPTAIRLGKNALHTLPDLTLQEAFAFTQASFGVMAATEDAQEGIRAFNEKRPPTWSGR